MKIVDGYEVLESVVVGMDPALDGFEGVLLELVFDGERYVLSETALGSGNRLLSFRSRDRDAAYALLEKELSGVGLGSPEPGAGFIGPA